MVMRGEWDKVDSEQLEREVGVSEKREKLLSQSNEGGTEVEGGEGKNKGERGVRIEEFGLVDEGFSGSIQSIGIFSRVRMFPCTCIPIFQLGFQSFFIIFRQY